MAGTLWMAARMSLSGGFIVWPPLTNSIHAQIAKHSLQALAIGHGRKAVLALGVNGGVR